MSQNNFQILRFVLLTFLIVKWVACMQYIVPMFWAVVGGGNHPDSWIEQSKIDDKDKLYKYVYVMFRSFGYLLCKLIIIYE